MAAIALAGERGFRIVASRGASGRDVALSPDVATCDDCLREIRDPSDRRYRYAFTNCTNCGPRLTIITGAPYDRERTTMASFVMCDRCRAEYDDPRDRRFHAQPVACPACGPRLALRDRSGEEIACEDPIAETARRLLGGGIAAIKGLGGYHLACDARSEVAVAELRRRKHRDEKPFAVMVADVAAAARLCDATPEDALWLASRERPITLMERGAGGDLRYGRRAGAFAGGRDAAVHAAAPPAARRGRRRAAGDDERQPLRRADRVSRRGRARAARGHRGRLPGPRPRDPYPLRRLGGARRRSAAAITRLRAGHDPARDAAGAAGARRRRAAQERVRAGARRPRDAVWACRRSRRALGVRGVRRRHRAL